MTDHGCGCGHDHADGDTLQIGAAAPGAGPAPELDVRTLPHQQRHEIIFKLLNALSVGQSLVLVNDHDPKPLRYQAEALWPGVFEWSYVDEGPGVWRLRIARVV